MMTPDEEKELRAQLAKPCNCDGDGGGFVSLCSGCYLLLEHGRDLLAERDRLRNLVAELEFLNEGKKKDLDLAVKALEFYSTTANYYADVANDALKQIRGGEK